MNPTIPAYRAMSNRLIEQAAQTEEASRLPDGHLTPFQSMRQAYIIDASGHAWHSQDSYIKSLDGGVHLSSAGAAEYAGREAAEDWDAAEAQFRALMAKYVPQPAWDNAVEFAIDHFDGSSMPDNGLFDAICAAFEETGGLWAPPLPT